METISGIEIFPLISLTIFFVFFVGLTIYVMKADKKTFKEIANIPLDTKDNENEQA